MNNALYARYLAIIGGQVFVVAMNGGLESATDADTNLRPIPLLPLPVNDVHESYSVALSNAWSAATMDSDAHSTTHVSGEPRLMGLIKLNAEDENNSYTLGNMQKFGIAPAASDVEINSDTAASAYAWSVLPLSEEFDMQSDSVATAHAVSPLGVDGGAESRSYVDCRVCAFNDQPIGATATTDSYGNVTLHLYEPKHGPSMGQFKTYGNLNVGALDTASVFGDIDIKTHSVSNGSAFDAVGMESDNASLIYDNATAYVWPLFNMDAYSESMSYTGGSADTPDVLPTFGGEGSDSDFSAYIHLLYLPIQTGDNLKIRQNFKGVTQSGTDLEVI